MHTSASACVAKSLALQELIAVTTSFLSCCCLSILVERALSFVSNWFNSSSSYFNRAEQKHTEEGGREAPQTLSRVSARNLVIIAGVAVGFSLTPSNFLHVSLLSTQSIAIAAKGYVSRGFRLG